MTLIGKIGIVATGVYGLFLLYVMEKMAAGTSLFSLSTLFFFALAMSPVAFVAHKGLQSRVWLIALLPSLLFGAYEIYMMGFVSKSSTTALGLIFLPMIQWAFLGVVAVLKEVGRA
ncbi:hypothetical protein [Qipengyuania seohaensis]|uniref:hypothetical protein n=1 Tax=Qipengyuania seohaensis TaxID=266951 RepID=UPI0012FD97D5|nr:hypothetical protein [Qipengyuania seohaensis]